MSDFWGFLAAVWEHGTAFLYGAAATTALLLFPYYGPILGFKKVNSGIPTWALYAFIVFCVFAAFFRAWREQKQGADAARAELKELSSPIFRIGFDLSIPQDEKNETHIFVRANIANVGAPSVCDRYTLVVVMADGRKLNTYPVWIGENGFTMQFASGQVVEVPQSEFLALKTATVPIPTGARVHGFLHFQLPNVRPAEIVDMTNFLFECRDIHGVAHSAEKLKTKTSPTTDLVPGINYKRLYELRPDEEEAQRNRK